MHRMRRRTASLLSLSKEEQLMIFEKMDNRQIVQISQACNSTKQFVEQNGTLLSKRPLRLHEGARISLGVHKGEQFMKVYFNFSERIEQFHKKITAISFDCLDIFILDQDLIPNLLTIFNEWKPICYSFNLHEKLTLEAIEVMKLFNVRNRVHVSFPDGIQELTSLKQSPITQCIEIRWARASKYFEEFQNFKKFTAPVSLQEANSVNKFFWDLHKAKNIGNLKEAEFSFSNIPLNISMLQDLLPGTPFPPLINLYSDEERLFLCKMSVADGKYVFIKDYNHDLPDNRRIKFVTLQIINNEQEIFNTLLREIGIYNYSEERRRHYFAMNNEKRAQELQYFKKRLGRKRKCKKIRA